MTKPLTSLRQAITAAERAYETGRSGFGKDALDIVNTQLLAELVEVLYQINDTLARAAKDKDEIQRLLLEYAPAPKPAPAKK